MSEAYTGGCACGAIRYEIAGEPLFSNHCQCRDCQRESGSGHASYVTFRRENVKVTGDEKTWDMPTDSGSTKSRHFCGTCGVAVYLTFAGMPDFVAVRVGSLDDPGRFAPQVVTYGARGYPWDVLDPGLKVFDKQPRG